VVYHLKRGLEIHDRVLKLVQVDRGWVVVKIKMFLEIFKDLQKHFYFNNSAQIIFQDIKKPIAPSSRYVKNTYNQ